MILKQGMFVIVNAGQLKINSVLDLKKRGNIDYVIFSKAEFFKENQQLKSGKQSMRLKQGMFVIVNAKQLKLKKQKHYIFFFFKAEFFSQKLNPKNFHTTNEHTRDVFDHQCRTA